MFISTIVNFLILPLAATAAIEDAGFQVPRPICPAASELPTDAAAAALDRLDVLHEQGRDVDPAIDALSVSVDQLPVARVIRERLAERIEDIAERARENQARESDLAAVRRALVDALLEQEVDFLATRARSGHSSAAAFLQAVGQLEHRADLFALAHDARAHRQRFRYAIRAVRPRATTLDGATRAVDRTMAGMRVQEASELLLRRLVNGTATLDDFRRVIRTLTPADPPIPTTKFTF